MQKLTITLLFLNSLLFFIILSFPLILKQSGRQNQYGYINPKDYYSDKTRFHEIADPSTVDLGNDEPPKDSLDRRWQKQNQAISDINITYLQTIPKDMLHTSLLTNTLVGKLYAIDTKGGVMKEYRFTSSYHFSAALVVRNTIGEPNGFVFDNEQVKALTVYDSTLITKKKIPLSSLHTGDNIRITETLDLRKPLATSRQETVIERYQ